MHRHFQWLRPTIAGPSTEKIRASMPNSRKFFPALAAEPSPLGPRHPQRCQSAAHQDDHPLTHDLARIGDLNHDHPRPAQRVPQYRLFPQRVQELKDSRMSSRSMSCPVGSTARGATWCCRRPQAPAAAPSPAVPPPPALDPASRPALRPRGAPTWHHRDRDASRHLHIQPLSQRLAQLIQLRR